MSKVYLIGIGGPSCSGKTTATRILRNVLKNTVIIYQDDFYKSDNLIPIDKETELANWDCPEAIDFDRFSNLIKQVKNNGGQLPSEYQSNEEANVHDGSSLISDKAFEELKKILSAFEEDAVFVFIDGFMLYYDGEVSNQLDSKISFTCSYDTLKSRRESRQGYHTASDNYWVDPPNYFDKIVWPEYVKLTEYYKANLKNENILVVDTDKDSIDTAALKIANKLTELL